MTAGGLAGAFHFVRASIVVLLAVVLADRHWAFIVLAVVAFTLLARAELSRYRRNRATEPVARTAWWAGILMPFGLGVWATFLYLGVRTKHAPWLAAAAAYLALIVLGSYRAAVIPWLIAWGAGAAHAYLVRDQVRLRLSPVGAAR